MPLPDGIDIGNPAVRDYLALVRLQVLTPLSLLISIATLMVSVFIVSPGLGTISKTHPTPISPSPTLIGLYLLAIFAGQIGYCVLLVLASKEETKRALIKGAGFALVIANWLLAGWAVAWVMQIFLVSTILLAILTLVLLYSNIVLLVYHPHTSSRPFDTLLIHAPVRLFLLLPALLLLPQSIFITIGKSWNPIDTPYKYKSYEWDGFAVVLVTNIIGLLIVAIHGDIVWCIGAVWINISILVERPKSPPVEGTAILFTVLHPVVLVAFAVWNTLRRRRNRQGAIALPADTDLDQEHHEHSREHGQNIERVWG